jgi:hypothetical protein
LARLLEGITVGTEARGTQLSGSERGCRPLAKAGSQAGSADDFGSLLREILSLPMRGAAQVPSMPQCASANAPRRSDESSVVRAVALSGNAPEGIQSQDQTFRSDISPGN